MRIDKTIVAIVVIAIGFFVGLAYTIKPGDVTVQVPTEEYGTFHGYAVIWNHVNRNGFGFRKGSTVLTTSLQQKFEKESNTEGTGIPVLWMHDSEQPIGRITLIREDEKGLYIEGQLNLAVTLGREAYELLKQKALNAVSVGAYLIKRTMSKPKVVDTELENGKPRAVFADPTFIDIATIEEISIVTFPAEDGARITVKR